MTTLQRWALLLLAAAAAWASAPAWAGASKPALAMVGDNWCPYNCDPQAPHRGYMVDVLDRILAPHYTLSYQLTPWTRAINMVETGDAQLLVATPVVANTKMRFSVALGMDQSCFFVRKGNPWRYTGLADLQGVRLGVIQDYSYDDNGPLDSLIAKYRSQNDPRLETALGENALEGNFRKLAAGRMDVVIENDNVGRYMVQQLKLQDAIEFAHCARHHVASTHVAVSLKSPDAQHILLLIHDGLRALRRSGELNRLLKPYGMSDWQSTKSQ